MPSNTPLSLDQASAVIRHAVASLIPAALEHDRRDAEQQTWLQVLPYWRDPPRNSEDEWRRSEPYLRTVATRVAQRQQGKRGKGALGRSIPLAEEQGEDAVGAQVQADENSGPTFRLERDDRRRLLAAAIQVLAERPRLIFVLKYLQGLSAVDIGQVLGIEGDDKRVQNIVNSSNSRAAKVVRQSLPEPSTLGGRGRDEPGIVTMFDTDGRPCELHSTPKFDTEGALCLRLGSELALEALRQSWGLAHLIDADADRPEVAISSPRRAALTSDGILRLPDLAGRVSGNRPVRVFLFEGPWCPLVDASSAT